MADGDNTGPILEELLGKDAAPNKSQPQAGGAVVSLVSGDDLAPPVHRMHQTRLVRNAGHMAVGSKMATPDANSAFADEVQPLFSSRPENARKRRPPRIAVAIACLVAMGATTTFTTYLGGADQGVPFLSYGESEKPAVDMTDAVAPAQPLLLAVSPASLAVPSPATAPDVGGHVGSASGFIRIAQKDAPGLEIANVFGPAGKPLHLAVSLSGAGSEDYSFLMFRGLPPKVTLSAGFRLKESWAVSLRDLDNLAIESPPDFQGSFNLEVLLIKGRDTPAESRLVSIEIVPPEVELPGVALRQPTPADIPAAQQPAPGPQVLTAAPRTIDEREQQVEPREQPAEPREQVEPREQTVKPSEQQVKPREQLVKPSEQRPPASPLPPAPAHRRPAIAPAEETAMMQRADGLLRNKDVMSARLVYEHLVNNGSTKAALAMGKTYDPAFLRTIEAAGLKPDVEKARQWYSRAADLGDQEAAKRLSALASR
jgi:hypothetical protein